MPSQAAPMHKPTVLRHRDYGLDPSSLFQQKEAEWGQAQRHAIYLVGLLIIGNRNLNVSFCGFWGWVPAKVGPGTVSNGPCLENAALINEHYLGRPILKHQH